MTQDFDLSDILARLKCYEIILSDIHPTGEWMLHELYQRYINQPYGGLNRREMAELLIDLQSEIDALTPENYRAWWNNRPQPLEPDGPPQDSNLQTVDQ